MHERAVCSVCESWAYLGVCVRDPGQHQPPFASCPLPLPGVPAYPAAANPHFARASLPPCLPCPKKTCLYSCDDVLCRIRGFPCIAFRSCVDCHAKVFFPLVSFPFFSPDYPFLFFRNSCSSLLLPWVRIKVEIPMLYIFPMSLSFPGNCFFCFFLPLPQPSCSTSSS